MRSAWVLAGAALLASPAEAEQQRPREPEIARPAPQARQRPVPQQRRGGSGTWHEESFRNRETLRIEPRGMFQLVTAQGDVTITGVDGDNVRVRATKKVMDDNADAARALLQNVQVRITQRGGGVEVLSELPATRSPVLIDYDIEVPSQARVYVRSHGGTVRVSNVKGELEVEAGLFGSGDVTLASVGSVRSARVVVGGITIESASGDQVTAGTIGGLLQMRDVTADQVNAETIGGALQLREVTARNIQLRTVGGAIRANNVQCDSCRFNTQTGRIDFAGPLKANARYQLNSTGGDIRMAPTGPVGFDLEALTRLGGFFTDLPLERDPASAPGRGADVVRGRYGDGSAIVSVRTFGNARIVKDGQ